jgi:hypothetical protein
MALGEVQSEILPVLEVLFAKEAAVDAIFLVDGESVLEEVLRIGAQKVADAARQFFLLLRASSFVCLEVRLHAIRLKSDKEARFAEVIFGDIIMRVHMSDEALLVVQKAVADFAKVLVVVECVLLYVFLCLEFLVAAPAAVNFQVGFASASAHQGVEAAAPEFFSA